VDRKAETGKGKELGMKKNKHVSSKETTTEAVANEATDTAEQNKEDEEESAQTPYAVEEWSDEDAWGSM
jgi:hypothetical protein